MRNNPTNNNLIPEPSENYKILDIFESRMTRMNNTNSTAVNNHNHNNNSNNLNNTKLHLKTSTSSNHEWTKLAPNQNSAFLKNFLIDKYTTIKKEFDKKMVLIPPSMNNTKYVVDKEKLYMNIPHSTRPKKMIKIKDMKNNNQDDDLDPLNSKRSKESNPNNNLNKSPQKFFKTSLLEYNLNPSLNSLDEYANWIQVAMGSYIQEEDNSNAYGSSNKINPKYDPYNHINNQHQNFNNNIKTIPSILPGNNNIPYNVHSDENAHLNLVSRQEKSYIKNYLNKYNHSYLARSEVKVIIDKKGYCNPYESLFAMKKNREICKQIEEKIASKRTSLKR